jgi:hypothetical protein
METEARRLLTPEEFAAKEESKTLTAQDIMNTPLLELCAKGYISLDDYYEKLKEIGEVQELDKGWRQKNILVNENDFRGKSRYVDIGERYEYSNTNMDLSQYPVNQIPNVEIKNVAAAREYIYKGEICQKSFAHEGWSGIIITDVISGQKDEYSNIYYGQVEEEVRLRERELWKEDKEGNIGTGENFKSFRRFNQPVIEPNAQLYKRAKELMEYNRSLSYDFKTKVLDIYKDDIYTPAFSYENVTHIYDWKAFDGYYIPSEHRIEFHEEGKGAIDVKKFEQPFAQSKHRLEDVFVAYTSDETIIYCSEGEHHLPADINLVPISHEKEHFLLDPDKESIYSFREYTRMCEISLDIFLEFYNEKVGIQHWDEVVKKAQSEPLIRDIREDDCSFRYVNPPAIYSTVVNLDACKYKNGVLYVPCTDENKGRFIGKQGTNIKEFSDRVREVKGFEGLKRVTVVDADHEPPNMEELIKEVAKQYPFSWDQIRFEAFKTQHPELGNITMDDEGYVFKMDENGNITDPENPIALYDPDTHEFTGYEGPKAPENSTEPENELDLAE